MAVTKITKSAINYAVIKATKAAAEPPARKHVETLIQAVRSCGNFIPVVVDSLIAKLKDKRWIVACKSLLLMHVILTQEKKAYEMLTQKIRQIDTSNVTDFKGPLGEPMRPVLSNYCRFMVSKLTIYFNLRIDPCDVTKQDLDSKMDTNPDFPCLLFEQLLLHIKVLISTAPKVHNESNFVPKQIFVLVYKEFIKLYGTMGVLTAYIINKAQQFSLKSINRFKANFQEFCDVHDNMMDILISANDLNILSNDFTPEKPPPALIESLHNTLGRRPVRNRHSSSNDDPSGEQKTKKGIAASKIYPNFYKKPLPQIFCNMISDRAEKLANHYNLEGTSNMLDLDDIYENKAVAVLTSNPFGTDEEQPDSDEEEASSANKSKNILEAEALAVLSCWAGTYFFDGTVILFGKNCSFEVTDLTNLKKKLYQEFLEDQSGLEQEKVDDAKEKRSIFSTSMDSAILELTKDESFDEDVPNNKPVNSTKEALKKLLFREKTDAQV